MKLFFKTLVFLVLANLTSTAFAYATQVSLRNFSAKLISDDVVVIDVPGVSAGNHQWFNSQDGLFQIWMIDNSVEVRMMSPNFSGIKPGLFSYTSLDKLHDLTVAGKPSSRRYDMRLLFDQNLLWVEVWPSDKRVAPVMNTVMFFGPQNSTYQYYLSHALPNVAYASEKEMKADINVHYAEKYGASPNPLIEYRPEGLRAISTVVSDSE